MKKAVIITALALSTAVGAMAQGTVVFNNRVVGTVVTHVYSGGTTQRIGNGTSDTSAGATDWTGYTLLSGSGFVSQLLAATGSNQAESSLVPALPTTTFRTGGAAGNITGVTATLTGVAADAPSATLEMVAWDNSSGLYPTWTQASVAWNNAIIMAGRSGTFNVSAIGGQSNPAPNITGVQSFNIYVVPEPTTLALAGLGAAALVIFRRRNK